MRQISDDRSASSEFKFDLHDYWRAFWNRKFLILLPVTVAAIVAVVGVRFLTPVYESSAVIEVKDNRFLSREVQQQITRDETRQRDHDRVILESIQSAIMGKEFQHALIGRLSLDEIPGLREEAEYAQRTRYPHMTTEDILDRRLRRLLTAKSGVRRAGPRLFEISFTDSDPNNCFVLADAIANLFVETQEQKEIQGLRTAEEFSDEQIAIYRQILSRSEEELKAFQKKIAQRDVSGGPVNEGNVRRAENLQQQLSIDVADARGIVDKVKRSLHSVANLTPDDGAFDRDTRARELRSELDSRREDQLLLELASSQGTGDGVAANEAALDNVQGALQRYLNGFVRRQYPSLASDFTPLLSEYYYQRANVASLETKARKLNEYVNKFQNRVTLAPEDQRELQRLRSEVSTNQDLLEQFIRAKAQTQISEAVQHMDLGWTISVIEPPERPFSPVRPNKMKIILLAVVFGCVIGASSFFVTEYMDSSFKKIEDIENELDTRVIGTIPALDSGSWNGESTARRTALWVAASVLIAALSITAFYFYGKRAEKDTIQVTTVTNTREH